MIFRESKLADVFEIDVDPVRDSRGFFARTWCEKEFQSRGLDSKLAQCSISFNEKKATLRGLHYQAEPYPEAKLVRCTQGAVWDVVVDLRTGSPTFCEWLGFLLTAANHKMVYVPAGCAHGLMTLDDNSEVLYQISEFYHPELSRGVRWNDPAFGIEWPLVPVVMSDRDCNYPDFNATPSRASL